MMQTLTSSGTFSTDRPLLVAREQIVKRIEALRDEFFAQVAAGGVEAASLVLTSRARAAAPARGEPPDPLRRTTARRFGTSPDAFARTWLVLDAVCELLRRNEKVTLRELYYQHCRSFGTYSQLLRAVRDCADVLCCTQHDLHVVPASRGFAVGALRVRLRSAAGHAAADGGLDGDRWLDVRDLGCRGLPISGDLDELEDVDVARARFVLVVEKDAVYFRLAGARLYDLVPCVLVTGCGFPDVATRNFVRRMHLKRPELPVLGLSDWNCGGISVMLTYHAGSVSRALDGADVAVPLRRIGLDHSDLSPPALGVDPLHAPLPAAEADRIRTLLARSAFRTLFPQYAHELDEMLRTGRRAEIESLYALGHQQFIHFVLHKCLSAQ